MNYTQTSNAMSRAKKKFGACFHQHYRVAANGKPLCLECDKSFDSEDILHNEIDELRQQYL